MMACLFVLITVVVFISYIDGQHTRKQTIKAIVLAKVGILASLVAYLTLLRESGGVDAGKWMAQMVVPVGLHILLLLALMVCLFRLLRK